jgi:hypothetical protein
MTFPHNEPFCIEISVPVKIVLTVKFWVYTAVIMKNSVFWDITLPASCCFHASFTLQP